MQLKQSRCAVKGPLFEQVVWATHRMCRTGEQTRRFLPRGRGSLGGIGVSVRITCGKGHGDRKLLRHRQITGQDGVQESLAQLTKAKSNHDSGSVCRRGFSQ